MSEKFALHLPINPVSFGQVSTLILREIFNKKLNPCLFPIGNVDLASQSGMTQEFAQWIQSCINRAVKEHKRSTPILKLWHLNGSLESFSDKQTLFSFYECDSPTQEELNIVKNNTKVIFSNDYSVNTFKDFGCDNVKKVTLGFDKYNFKDLNKKYFNDGRISFGFYGKAELTRKRSAKVIQDWIKEFGNNPKYFLNCAIWNLFLQPEQQKQMYQQIVGPNRIGNIQFLNFQPQNELYNDVLNSNDICLSMATEGWDLPLFQSLCIGKEAVVLNCAGHKEYCDDLNSVMIAPSAKIPIYDNMFFHPNQPFNQGNCYDYDSKSFIDGCYKAIERVEASRKNNTKNLEGLKLQEKFTSEKMVDELLSEVV